MLAFHPQLVWPILSLNAEAHNAFFPSNFRSVRQETQCQ